MYIVTSEVLLNQDKKSLASQYHDVLVPHLHRIPGFIEEKRYASVNVPDKGVTLTRWESAAAIGRWRNQSDHLPIQEKGSRDVFKEYRLRIGPVNGVEHGVVESSSRRRGSMVLYWRPKGSGQDFCVWKMSEVKDGAVPRVVAAMLDNAVYEDGESILRLSGWSSIEDALLYEACVVRVEGDRLERVSMERDYTGDRRDDAPHQEPGQVA